MVTVYYRVGSEVSDLVLPLFSALCIFVVFSYSEKRYCLVAQKVLTDGPV